MQGGGVRWGTVAVLPCRHLAPPSVWAHHLHKKSPPCLNHHHQPPPPPFHTRRQRPSHRKNLSRHCHPLSPQYQGLTGPPYSTSSTRQFRPADQANLIPLEAHLEACFAPCQAHGMQPPGNPPAETPSGGELQRPTYRPGHAAMPPGARPKGSSTISTGGGGPEGGHHRARSVMR